MLIRVVFSCFYAGYTQVIHRLKPMLQLCYNYATTQAKAYATHATYIHRLKPMLHVLQHI